MRLDNKVAIVTGAAHGIGRATAITFAREGASVLVADVDDIPGKKVVDVIRRRGEEATYIHADVALPTDNQRMVDVCLSAYGRLDILFCNAGIALPRLLPDTTDEEVERVLDINVKALLFGARAALPVMLRQGQGVILFTASKAGLVGQPNSPVYCASKGAAVLLAKALALDYATHNIRVNALCPGIVDTAMFREFVNAMPDPEQALARARKEQPIGRLGTPQECADAALWLVSDEASFVTGIALPIDGGITAM